MNDDPLNCPKEPPKELEKAFSLNGSIGKFIYCS